MHGNNVLEQVKVILLDHLCHSGLVLKITDLDTMVATTSLTWSTYFIIK